MKIILQVIICIMSILLMGCSDVDNIIKENLEAMEIVDTNPICTDLDQVEENIKLAIDNLDNEVKFTYKGDNSDILQRISDTIKKVIDENGEYTVLVSNYETETTSYAYKSKVKISFKYNLSQEEYSEVKDRVNSIISEIIDPSMGDFEKEKAINDWIVTNIEYDKTKEKTNAYTALFEGKTVCSGYAHLAKLMLDKVDIQNKLITGGDHAWNIVYIEGKWYHLDTTWNDPSYVNISDKMHEVSYEYFNVTDEFISKSHSWDRTLYPLANTKYEGIRKKTMLSLADIRIGGISLYNFDPNTHKYYLNRNEVQGKSIEFIPRSSVAELRLNKFSNRWEIKIKSEEYEDIGTYILYFN
ncbi:transglutaminase domain-containing protein [Tepidibacter hydrothermalis]|uniref:Transglutaminase domain-containing protein n=1 Tax=Tepidibacter hydrothermalis TaxID=3036126 RepID=A0ABY8EBR5_9FIRM|nr:transglutaminase domain-containing protein [Tepidibacter hydrothermalis]WFD08952.1 transglutaminase domain-containing protein [Tepidibacter hydrothermalis]